MTLKESRGYDMDYKEFLIKLLDSLSENQSVDYIILQNIFTFMRMRKAVWHERGADQENKRNSRHNN